MINIAVLLDGPILNDSRVIKIIKTLVSIEEQEVQVDLFYINGTDKDRSIFSDQVSLNSTALKVTPKIKFLRHSFFYNQYLFYVPLVLAKKAKYDYIYANDLPCLKPALILKEKLQAKVIYDAHEIYTETINQFFPQQTNFIKGIFFKFLIVFMKFIGERAENSFLKKVDYFITVGEGLKKYFEEKYNATGIKVLMNVPSGGSSSKPLDVRNILNLKETDFLILYQGNYSLGRGLHLMIEALKYTDPRVKLILLGQGFIEPSLRELVLKNNLTDKAFFLGKVDSKILPQYTAACDCGMNLLEPVNLSKKFAAPNKLFEYIHAGIPVIASYSYESDVVFSKYNIGLQVENNLKDISEAMNKMSKMDRSIFEENCQKAALEYNWQNQELILKEIIKSNQRS